MAGLLCPALLAGVAAAATTPKSAARSTSAKSAKKSAHHPSKNAAKGKKGKKASWRTRGQRGIQPERVRQIQAALIRENYLAGEPNGVLDQRTKDALVRYQSDNGWQSKVVPDSRALIKLGLGPDHSNLINPDTAATGPIPGGGSGPSSSATNRDQ